jgi:CubicO group peptidase (beta-lactamase class C family)
MYPQIIPRLTGKDWESFLKDTFYQPLGATTLTYNARLHYDLNKIVPTEYDSLFRKTLIHGRVHDEGAAMLNGISGHAGLFGNANDLAKLMQMYLQKGYYGGKRFIKESTLNEWTSYPFSVAENSRRGIGFDKPDRKSQASVLLLVPQLRALDTLVLQELILGLTPTINWCMYS